MRQSSTLMQHPAEIRHLHCRSLPFLHALPFQYPAGCIPLLLQGMEGCCLLGARSVGPSFAGLAQYRGCTQRPSTIIPWPRSHHKRVMCHSLLLLSYIGLWPERGPAEPRSPLRLRLRVVVLCVVGETAQDSASLLCSDSAWVPSKWRVLRAVAQSRTVTHLGGARPLSAQEIPFPVARPVLIYGLRGPERRGLLLNILFGPFGHGAGGNQGFTTSHLR